MSIFDELGLDDPKVVDPTEGLAPGQYKSFIDKAVFEPSKKDASKRNLVLTYKVAEGDFKGKTVREYKSANTDDDPQSKGWLKKRLKDLDALELKSLADLIGKQVVIKVVKNGQYSNVSEVVLLSGDGQIPAAFAKSIQGEQQSSDW